MKKALIAMLAIMLLIIVVFTSFGFAYSKNDFVSTMLKVEHGLGDTSDKVMTTYTKTKTLAEQVGDFLNRFVNVGAVFDRVYTSSIRLLEEGSALFSFFGDYGFNKLDKNFAILSRCFGNPDFWDPDFNFDYSKARKLINAISYGEVNEFSYLIEKDKEDAANYFNNRSINTTYVIYNKSTSVKEEQKANIHDCLFWFQSVDLTVDPDFMFYADSVTRQHAVFESKFFDIGETNIYYKFDDGCIKTPSHFFLVPVADDDGSSLVNGFVSFVSNSILQGWNFQSSTIKINDIYYTITFVFDHPDSDSADKAVGLVGYQVINRLLYSVTDSPFFANYSVFPVAGLYTRDDVADDVWGQH